jgi:hypothetical protein
VGKFWDHSNYSSWSLKKCEAHTIINTTFLFRNCRRNLVHRLVFVICLYPLYGVNEVNGEVVVVKSLSYILLLMALEHVWDWDFCSYRWVFFVCFLFSLVWFFMWLPKVVLILLFLPHHENEVFFVFMIDIHFCNVYLRLELSIVFPRMLNLLWFFIMVTIM